MDKQPCWPLEYRTVPNLGVWVEAFLHWRGHSGRPLSSACFVSRLGATLAQWRHGVVGTTQKCSVHKCVLMSFVHHREFRRPVVAVHLPRKAAWHGRARVWRTRLKRVDHHPV